MNNSIFNPNVSVSDLTAVSSAYYKLLASLDWHDEVLMRGLREGLNKFVSNAVINLRGGHKYYQGDFYTMEALDLLRRGLKKGLVYEHIVPKQSYIQEPCEREARLGRLTEAAVRERLERYYVVAIVTKQQDKNLPKAMPQDWCGQDLFTRYRSAGLSLLPNPASAGHAERFGYLPA